MKYIICFLLLVSCATSFAQLPYEKERVTTDKEVNLKRDPMSPLRGISYNGDVYYIEKDFKTITAYKASGGIKWQVDISKVVECPCVGEPGIKYIMIGNQMVYGDVFEIKDNELFVVYAKHDFAKINIETGIAKYLGAD